MLLHRILTRIFRYQVVHYLVALHLLVLVILESQLDYLGAVLQMVLVFIIRRLRWIKVILF